MPNRPIKIVISGGGTGGHIFPAIAIAQAIQKLRPDTEFLFVGANGRMEMEKVPAAGYTIVGLDISGLQRQLSLKLLWWPVQVLLATNKAKKIVKEFNPDAAIGVGGYASGPTLQAAAGFGIPCLIHEQNSFAGITNKLLKNKVSRICVAFDGMEKFFPKERLMKTGNPIRKEILNKDVNKAAAYSFFGLDPAKKTILVIGGSLGARTINESIFDKSEHLEKEGVQVLWQTGKWYYNIGKSAETKAIKVHEFIYRMDLAYAIADVVISRAGAISIAEIAYLQKPVILVPSPNVAEDHQTKNAEALVKEDAAILVTDAEAKNNLVYIALGLIHDEEKKEQMRRNILHFSAPNAPEVIANEVLKLIKA
jgi:UDP-N-acetylglucosamine--N-acetylmuramyl-(pentapeptide) pyrophosphoryl-undecaprenol N-acetylglucosamine transferase